MNDTTTAVDDAGQSNAVDAVTRQQVVRAMFDALDCGDIVQMVQYMTEDVVTAFGNFPELNGKAAFPVDVSRCREVGQRCPPRYS